jgi:hypothetical protein
MLAYTITNGGTYSTDAYEYKYTTSITQTSPSPRDTENPCGNNFPETISYTFYTASTEKLFHNGRRLESIFISYKDNQPTSFKVRVFDSDGNTNCVGGYYSTNSFTLKGYTIQEPNGKRTEYSEAVEGVNDPPRGGSRTILGSTIIKWTKPWVDTTAVPVITTQTLNRGVYNTIATNISFESSFIKVGDSLSLVNFEKTQKTNGNAIGGKTTEWIISNKKEKTTLGHSYGGTLYTPYLEINSLDFNYADTVVFITNNNILWYITDYGEGEFTKKFKSTRGIGKQVTIKRNMNIKLEELPIGFRPYGEITQPVKSTSTFETTNLSVISFKNQSFTDNVGTGFPLATSKSETPVLTVSTLKITTRNYTRYDFSELTEKTTNYNTLLQLINGNTLRFHRTYKAIDTISTSKSFVTYSFGEYTESIDKGSATGGITIKDEIVGYTSLVKQCYSINTEGGGEFIFNKGYINGQAAINNLNIVEQVSFKDGQTYNNINGNGSAVLYRGVPLAFVSFAKSFTFNSDNNTKTATAYSPIQDTNLKLDLRYVLISSSKEATSSNKEKYTIIDTTKHEFVLKGGTPKTYLNYRPQNLNNGLLVNPNQYCNLSNIKNTNCAIFCDDGQLKSFITRIIYPGTYLAINIDGIKNSVIEKAITTVQNNKFYYYLPWNGSIQSNGTLNLLSPSITSSSHDISNFLPELGSMTKI